MIYRVSLYFEASSCFVSFKQSNQTPQYYVDKQLRRQRTHISAVGALSFKNVKSSCIQLDGVQQEKIKYAKTRHTGDALMWRIAVQAEVCFWLSMKRILHSSFFLTLDIPLLSFLLVLVLHYCALIPGSEACRTVFIVAPWSLLWCHHFMYLGCIVAWWIALLPHSKNVLVSISD